MKPKAQFILTTSILALCSSLTAMADTLNGDSTVNGNLTIKPPNHAITLDLRTSSYNSGNPSLGGHFVQSYYDGFSDNGDAEALFWAYDPTAILHWGISGTGVAGPNSDYAEMGLSHQAFWIDSPKDLGTVSIMGGNGRNAILNLYKGTSNSSMYGDMYPSVSVAAGSLLNSALSKITVYDLGNNNPSIELIGGNTAAGVQPVIKLNGVSIFTSPSFGSGTSAGGQFSAAFGVGTTAQSYASLVLGRYNSLQGTGSTWNSGDDVFVIGNGTGSLVNQRSNALSVKKNGDTAIDGKLAAGALAQAFGEDSFAIGYNAHADEAGSAAIGFHTHAANTASMSIGYESEASGYHSIVLGNSLDAEGARQIVLGNYNAPQGDHIATTPLPSDLLFILGNGREPDAQGSEDPATLLSNALTVNWNGDTTTRGGLWVRGITDPNQLYSPGTPPPLGTTQFDGNVVFNGDTTIHGTLTNSGNLSLDGTANRTISVGQSNGVGRSLTIQAGASSTVGTQYGGTLVLASGPSSGAGGSGISLQTASGTALQTRMTIASSGKVGIGTTNPTFSLDLGTNDFNWVNIGRNSVASGYAGVIYSNGSTNVWLEGLRASDSYYHLHNGANGSGFYVDDQGNFNLLGASKTFVGKGLSIQNNTGGQAGDFTNGVDANIQFSVTASGAGDKFGKLQSNFNSGLVLGTNNTERMRISPLGNVGIGTTAPTSKLHVSNTSTDISGNLGASYVFNNWNPSASVVYGAYGGVFDSWKSGPTSLGITGYPQVAGVRANVTNTGTGTIALTAAFTGMTFTSPGAGAINSASVFHANAPSAQGPITNSIGLYVDEMKNSSVTNVTNGYSIYSIGANDKAYFAGKVGIGTSNPQANLHVTGTAQFDGGLAVGSGGITIGGASVLTTTQANSTYLPLIPVSLGFASGTVNADHSAALGLSVQATGVHSAAFGYASKATAQNSAAFGYNSWATADGSFATGRETQANNSFAASFGYGTRANSTGSVAFGYYGIAAGDMSAVFGNSNYTGHFATAAFGSFTQATGACSTSFGNYTIASGDRSTTFGLGTTAQGSHQLALGRYNVVQGDQYNWVNTDDLFIVGNGVDAAHRANAFTIKKNGDTTITAASLQLKDTATGATKIELKSNDPVNGPSIEINGKRVLTTAEGNVRHLMSVTYASGATTTSPTSSFLDGLPTANGAIDQGTIVAFAEHDATYGGTTPIQVFLLAVNNNLSPDANHVYPLDYDSESNDVMWQRLSFDTGSGTTGTTSSADHFYTTGSTPPAGTSLGANSVAFGQNSIASEANALAGGNGSLARQTSLAFGDHVESGEASVAFGSYTNSFGFANASFGSGTYAGGSCDAAFGYHTNASGNNSVAFGNGASASGYQTAAFGSSTQAVGYDSAAFGIGTVAQGRTQFVIGSGNIPQGDPSEGGLWTDDAFIIGNGSTTSPSNALTVKFSGDTWLSGGLTVEGGSASQPVKSVFKRDAEVRGSLAAGPGTVATGGSQVVVGKYNDTRTNDAGVDHTQGVFVVASGTSTAPVDRKNAIRVLEDGTVLIKPQGNLSMGQFGTGTQP